MASVRNLCKTGILLDKGCIDKTGEINEVVDYYLQGQKTLNDFERWGNGDARFVDFKQSAEGIELGDDLAIDFTIYVNKDCELINISLDIKDETMSQISHIANYDDQFVLRNVKAGETLNVHCVMKNLNLAPGSYCAHIWMGDPYNAFDWVGECVRFYIKQGERRISLCL